MSGSAGRAPAPVLEATTNLTAGAPLLVTVRSTQPSVLAGGPLNIAWELRTRSGHAFVQLGGDRARHRYAGMSFVGRLESSGAQLSDPTDVPTDLDFGGPVGSTAIDHNTPVVITVLVNHFVTLERTVPALPPGSGDMLVLDCQWQVKVARQQDMSVPPEVAEALLTLRLPIERNDAALESLVTERVTALLNAQVLDTEALGELAALRYPGTPAIVKAVGVDQGRVAAVLSGLPG